MALGRRLFDLARSELNTLLDKAARLGEGDSSSGEGLESFSEAELEAELERRRLEREIEQRARQERVGRAATGGATATRGKPAQAGPTPRPSGTSSSRPRTAARPPTAASKVARAYAALELAPGTEFPAVKTQYRNLMRKYHPDKHAGSPEKEKAAHELTQKLTDAYKTLEQHLRKA